MSFLIIRFMDTAPASQHLLERFPPYSMPESFPTNFLQGLSCTVIGACWFQCFPEWRMLPRCRPHDILFFVIKGHGKGIIENRVHQLQPGFCLSFRRGQWHEVRHDPKRPLHVLVVHYTALLDFSLTLPEVAGFPDLFDLKGDPLAQGLLWETCRLGALKPIDWQRAWNASALSFLYRMIYQHGSAFEPGQPERLSDLARLSPAIQLMRESFASPLSVADFARRASLSAAQFRRIFRRMTGMPPNHFLRKLRLEQAAHLLRSTCETIESISARVGYSESAFFAKTFKAEMGIAPGAYRRKRDMMDY